MLPFISERKHVVDWSSLQVCQPTTVQQVFIQPRSRLPYWLTASWNYRVSDLPVANSQAVGLWLIHQTQAMYNPEQWLFFPQQPSLLEKRHWMCRLTNPKKRISELVRFCQKSIEDEIKYEIKFPDQTLNYFACMICYSLCCWRRVVLIINRILQSIAIIDMTISALFINKHQA